MQSLTSKSSLEEGDKVVLILIVVEYALIQRLTELKSHLNLSVLILIVVEYALIRGYEHDVIFEMYVLILIVVEYALIHVEEVDAEEVEES